MSKTRRVIAYPPIEKVSGKFALEKTICSSEKPRQSKSYFGAKIRKTTNRNLFYFRENPLPDLSDDPGRAIFKFAAGWKAFTVTDPQLLNEAITDYKEGRTIQGCNPRDYTFSGFVFAVRYAQKKANPSITPTDFNYHLWPNN